MKTFKSKQDAWLVAVIYLSSAICFFTSAYVLAEGVSLTNIIIASFTSLIGGLFPIWLIVSLRYFVDDKMLKIKCGLFSWEIELSSIRSVAPSSDLSSAPALSVDRLLIVYGVDKHVLVSPEDKDSFVSALGVNEL